MTSTTPRTPFRPNWRRSLRSSRPRTEKTVARRPSVVAMASRSPSGTTGHTPASRTVERHSESEARVAVVDSARQFCQCSLPCWTRPIS